MTKINLIPPYSVNIQEAAKYTGLSVNHIRKLRYRGELPASKLGKNLIFTLHDLKVVIDFHRVEVPR